MKVTLRRFRTVLGVGFRADRRMSALAFVLTIVGSVAGPLVSLWLKSFIDAAVGGDQSSAIGAGIVLALVWVTSIVASSFSTYVSWGVEVHIIRLVFADLVKLSERVPTIEMHERPDIVDRIDLVREDVESFGFAMSSIVWAVGIVTRLTTTVVVLLSVHPLLILLPLLGVPSLIVGGRTQRARQRVREEMIEDRRLSEHLFALGTTPGPGKELRIFGLTGEIAPRHGVLRHGMQMRERRAELRATLAMTLGWLAYAVGYAGAIVFVTALAVDGRATVGAVVLVITLSAQIRDELAGTVGLIGWFFQTLRVADHYLWIQDYAERAAARRRPSAPAPDRLADGVRFEGVSFRYPGTDVDVLKDVDLTIPAGSAIAIVGVNGAGKTTLAKLLAGFYEPTQGRITVDGVDLRDLDLDAWRGRMSACFQDFVHFEYTAGESVGLGDLPRMDDDLVLRAALSRASATDVVEHLPDGLGTLIGKEYGDGVELSFGQWQKLALGRAMMRDRPLVLILDEPTASLDAYTEHAIFERYARESERAGGELGAITILISHRFSTVLMADLVVVLEKGLVAQTGTHDLLVGVPGPYQDLYELQSRAYR
jgi:ATP-binding cassette, subfamily B, bacterial